MILHPSNACYLTNGVTCSIALRTTMVCLYCFLVVLRDWLLNNLFEHLSSTLPKSCLLGRLTGKQLRLVQQHVKDLKCFMVILKGQTHYQSCLTAIWQMVVVVVLLLQDILYNSKPAKNVGSMRKPYVSGGNPRFFKPEPKYGFGTG